MFKNPVNCKKIKLQLFLDYLQAYFDFFYKLSTCLLCL